MKTFLAVIGALAIAFVLAVIVLVLLIRWKIRRMAEEIVGNVQDLALAAEKSSVPPFRIRLAPVSAIEWAAPQKVKELARALRADQFADVGQFISEPANLRHVVFYHPQESAYAYHSFS